MTIFNQSSIAVVNLDTLAKVFIFGNQLTASLAVTADYLKVGHQILVLRGEKVVALGRITEFFDSTVPYFVAKGSIKMDIEFMKVPVRPSPRQRLILAQLAKERKLSFPGLQSVLAIPPEIALSFHSLLERLPRFPWIKITNVDEYLHDEALHLLMREDISDAYKIWSSLNLRCEGPLAEFVRERDANSMKYDDEALDVVVTRIVPWQFCSDEERGDADNYMLIEKPLADYFAFGLISFRNTGRMMRDSAIDKNVLAQWTYPEVEYAELTKGQKKYMAYHREHVYKQWRTGVPKPQYGEVSEAGLSKIQEVNTMLSGLFKSWNLETR